jgi:ABC-type Fe3+/spermidine/putrescine transport system ATPase subunit
MSSSGPAHIEVEDLVIRYGTVEAVRSIGFSVARGELVTLLGPSGCGKTTTLRAIAGLETPAAGEIRIDGRAVFSSARRVNVPTERRDISMVFQSYAIWPHMSVFDNVAYPLRVRRMGRRDIDKNVQRALDLVQLGDVARRSAVKLSGGQQQRVALARAIVFSPTVLLLDEPLSNLDARLRAEMRVEIRDLRRRIGVTAVYVTHDQEEALAISDRVIVMNGGVIEQDGTPSEIYNAPRNAFVADFIGSANLIRGRIRRDESGDGMIALETPGGRLVYGVDRNRTAGTEGVFAIRTAYPVLSRVRPAGARNVWPARITRRVFLGDSIEYLVDWEDAALVVRTRPTEEFDEGEEVHLALEPRHCVLIES